VSRKRPKSRSGKGCACGSAGEAGASTNELHIGVVSQAEINVVFVWELIRLLRFWKWTMWSALNTLIVSGYVDFSAEKVLAFPSSVLETCTKRSHYPHLCYAGVRLSV
jgi:hypothetical protein